MRLTLFALFLSMSCAPQRDPSFTSMAQFTTVNHLEVAGDFIYFLESGQLRRVPTAGGAITTIGDMFGARGLAASAAAVYVTSDSGVYRVPSGGDAERVSSDTAAYGIAADSIGLTWRSCSTLTQAALDGKVLNTIALNANDCHSQGSGALAVDASTIYGTDALGLWLASRAGGSLQRVSALQCTRVQVSGGLVYCSSTSGLLAVDAASSRQFQSLTGQVRDFDLIDGQVYAALDEKLVAMPQVEGEHQLLGAFANITAVAVDASSVYFVNSGGGLGLLVKTSR